MTFKTDDVPNGGHDRTSKERGNWSLNQCGRLLVGCKTGVCDGKGCDDCIRFSMFKEKR
jgi:hypothetical protein